MPPRSRPRGLDWGRTMNRPDGSYERGPGEHAQKVEQLRAAPPHPLLWQRSKGAHRTPSCARRADIPSKGLPTACSAAARRARDTLRTTKAAAARRRRLPGLLLFLGGEGGRYLGPVVSNGLRAGHCDRRGPKRTDLQTSRTPAEMATGPGAWAMMTTGGPAFRSAACRARGHLRGTLSGCLEPHPQLPTPPPVGGGRNATLPRRRPRTFPRPAPPL